MVMNAINNTGSQLELTFEAAAFKSGRATRHQRRLSRARWWFEQMHTAVDRAFDWSTPPAAAPEQTNLALAGSR